jgi:stage IV sporulation protein FB
MTIFKINSMEIKINPLLFPLFAVYVYFGYIIEVSIILITVFTHELVHLLTAQKLGFKVRELELFPFGGIGKLDSIIGPDPKIEIIISLAGPIINILFAFLFRVTMEFFYTNPILELLFKCNFYMGIFNLLPVLPLDGGRILRGLLSYIIGFKASTNRLTYITYGFSIVLIIIGIYSMIYYRTGIYYAWIAIFISIAANKEKKMAAFIFIKEIAEKKAELTRRGIMKTQHFIVLGSMSVHSILDYFLPKRYHIIIVVDKNGNTIGTLNENELFDGIMKYDIDVKIEKLLKENKKC